MNTSIKTKKLSSLRQRIILTIGLLTLVRLGSFIPLPYLDRPTLDTLVQVSKGSANTSLGEVLNTFSSGGTNAYSVFSLGILPYINASIILQLLTTVIPSLSKMQKEEGEYGRRKINDYIRYLTFFLSILQSVSFTFNLKKFIFDWNVWTGAQVILVLITGSMIVVWFSELITRHGVGNGSSLLICFNIISSLPDNVSTFLSSFENLTQAIPSSLAILTLFLMTTLACIFINEALVKIPLISARQLVKKKERLSPYTGKTILPLRVNQSGVMPLVFTSYVVVILSFCGNLIKSQAQQFFPMVGPQVWESTLGLWGGKIVFWGLYSGLIFFFTYFYSTLILDPNDMAEKFRKNSVIIRGIPPGKTTRLYLRETLKRISTINALFLIGLIVGLQGFSAIFPLNLTNVRGIGFTSQIILVNVLIDTLKRIRSYLNEEKNNFTDDLS